MTRIFVWFMGLTVCLSMLPLMAQIPQDIPHQTDPVDFSDPRNILLYIGVPLLMVVLYVMIRKWRRNKQNP